MPKKARELSALEVSRLTRPGMHPVGGVTGLYLNVKPTGARSWILRTVIGGKRRNMGLGAFGDVTLAEAREAARKARAQAREGIDPIEERHRALDALKSAQAKRLTFAEAARRFLKRKGGEFRNGKHLAQWRSTLETYAFPTIGELPVDQIEIGHIVKILEPIWTTKTETATRVRGRIESVLSWATVCGFRSGDNPARWRGNLDAILPKPGKLKKVTHHAAVSIDEAPAVMAEIRKRNGNAARCLQFLIFTACRSLEARAAKWDEIDFTAGTWTIPAERMKATKQHVVPLCAEALELLESMPEENKLIFPAPRGGIMSTTALTAVLRRIGRKETVHGWRSTFRDWCSERTNYAHEVAEQALAHVIPNATERAYRRGQLLAKRDRLMRDWCRFLIEPARAGEVVPMKRQTTKASA